MAILLPIRKCEVLLDTSGLPVEALSAAAWREIEIYVSSLERHFEISGVTLKSVELKPVATGKLLALLKEDGLFHIQALASPMLVKGG